MLYALHRPPTTIIRCMKTRWRSCNAGERRGPEAGRYGEVLAHDPLGVMSQPTQC